MSLSILKMATAASTGGAGASTAAVTTSLPITGIILWVYLKYNDSPPGATTDVTLKTTATGSGAPPAQTILSVSNAATDGYFYPRVPEHLASTGAAITDSYDWPVVVNDTLTLTILQANDGDSVEAWVAFETNG